MELTPLLLDRLEPLLPCHERPIFAMSTAENRGQKGDVATAASDEEEPDMCWLCLDGEDESGQPLRRDCSCRGGSGWAHLSCVVGYAKQETEKGKNIIQPWRICPGCKQSYQNELAVELANTFVAFVEGRYPDDKLKHLQALRRKLYALVEMIGSLQPKTEEAEQVANKIFSIIEQMKTSDPSLPQPIQKVEASTYYCLGYIAFDEGTKEGAKSAMEYFEKSRVIYEEADYTRGVTFAESNLARAKSRYEGSSNENKEEEALQRRQKLYMQHVKTRGQDHFETIKIGMNLAIDLKGVHRVIEAERLLTKLVAICERVHGPHHQVTKSAKSNLHQCKVRSVGIKYRDEIKRYQALRYEDDGRKCVVQGSIANPRNIQEEETLTVDTIFLGFALGLLLFAMGWNLMSSKWENWRIATI